MGINVVTSSTLTTEDETELGRRIEAGLIASAALAARDHSLGTVEELLIVEREGAEAWQRFLLANMCLVRLQVLRCGGRSGVSFDELFQDGFVGLTEALQRWDFRRGLRFSTFARHWIRRAVLDCAVIGQGDALVCAKTVRRARRLRYLESRLTQERGRPVDPAELAEVEGSTLARVRALLGHQPVAPLDGIDVALAAQDESDRGAGPVEDAMAGLPSSMRRVLRLRYGFETGEPVGQVEVAVRLGMSESTVRRYERRALELIRVALAPARAPGPAAPLEEPGRDVA